MQPFFQVTSRDGEARAGELLFRHEGQELRVPTPIFMPVGTRATVKSLWQEQLEEIGYDLILGNTYHLYLRPGRLIERLGGLKRFMGWEGHAILTDSGGFQVFSLSQMTKFQEDGVQFQSHIDGSRHLFTPESVLETQLWLGSDIMMPLDDCPPGDADANRLGQALDRTHRWARTAWARYEALANDGSFNPEQNRLFGIVQGGVDESARLTSLAAISELPFAGIALGGLSVGESREDMYRILSRIGPRMDPARPRYLMGVGTIPDFLEAIQNGIDMFDCVLPTRNARNGQALTSQGTVNLRNACHAEDSNPVDPECHCRVCRRYSRAYVRHLFQSGEMLGPELLSYHNLAFFHGFLASARRAIQEGTYTQFYARWKQVAF